MNKVITVSREFGSGGREFARRLADKLGFAYYDSEIITELAKRTSLAEEYISALNERCPAPLFPISIGQTFSPAVDVRWEHQNTIFNEQTALLKELAEKSDCVIVGRCADYTLRDFDPIRIRIYAEPEARIERCKARADSSEKLTDREIKQKINEINKSRSRYYQFYTGKKWEDALNYDICINTTGKDIAKLVEDFAATIK